MKKKIRQSIVLILAVLMVLSSLPLNVIAQETANANNTSTNASNEKNDQSIITNQGFKYRKGNAGITIVGCTSGDDTSQNNTEHQKGVLMIPDTLDNQKVIGIGAEAFKDILEIEVVKIGANMADIDPSAFNGCSNMKYVDVDDTNTIYMDDSGVLMKRSDQSVVYKPVQWDGTQVITSNDAVKTEVIATQADSSRQTVALTKDTMPKSWSGEYDGYSGEVTVRRKYFISIDSISDDGTIKGIGRIDRLNNSSLQETGTYYFKGNVDFTTRKIVFQGYEWIQHPVSTNFTFAYFNASISNDTKSLDGTTEYGTVNMKAITSNGNISDFPYSNNEYNQDLAENCIKYDLVVGGKVSFIQDKVLIKNESNEGDSKITPIAIHVFSLDGLTPIYIDCPGKDGYGLWLAQKQIYQNGEQMTLLYAIVRGTMGDQWYGNFDVTGSAYDESLLNTHYSFNQSAKDIVAIIKNYLSNANINKAEIVVTGHSRGGAVANLVAKQFTDDSKKSGSPIADVFGYTFATPNVTQDKNASKDYDNIRNFCMTDDFVPYFPLAKWGYGKYGITSYANAASLYQNNSRFKENITQFLNKLVFSNVNYKAHRAKSLIDIVAGSCDSVDEYYSKWFGDTHAHAAWYQFCTNVMANFLAGGKEKPKKATEYALAYSSMGITQNFPFFRALMCLGWGTWGYGTNQYSFPSYLGNTHDPMTYYAAVNAGNVWSSDSNVGLKSQSINTQNATESVNGQSTPDVTEVAALKDFAAQGDNLSNLGWDLNTPSSWKGITWNGSGKVEQIDIFGLKLSGTLNLNNFDALTELECSGNTLTGLNVSGCTALTSLSCYGNQLTTLDLSSNSSLNELSCDGNYLDVEDGSAFRNQIDTMSLDICEYTPQAVPDNASFNPTDTAKLKAFAQQNDNLAALGWSDVNAPLTWTGVTWQKSGDSYYVTAIDFSNLKLTGSLDLSGMSKLTKLECYGNTFDVINVADNASLAYLNCSQCYCSTIDFSNCNALTTLFCPYNYLSDNQLSAVKDLAAKEGNMVEYSPQCVNASQNQFNSDDMKNALALVKDLNLGWDESKPGTWNGMTWSELNGQYVLTGINLAGTELSGDADLSVFDHLTSLNLSATNIASVTFPSSLTELGDEAFAGCSQLKRITTTSSFGMVGYNTFIGCSGVTIVGAKNSFSEFLAKALDFTFEVQKELDTIEITNAPNKTTYKLGESFDAAGLKVKAIYTDKTSKEVTNYKVSGFDSSSSGTKELTITYKEGNVSRSATFNVTISTESSLPSISYITHIQNLGWNQGWKIDGDEAGTHGQSLRLEAIQVKLSNAKVSGSVQYKTHIQNKGWETNWSSDGAVSGTSGLGLRLEAIQIQLTGEMANQYDIYYRVHAQNFGWLGWAKNGESAGTAGYAYRLEAIQIQLVKKGGAAPGSTDNAFKQPLVSYQTHVQNVGWQNYVNDGGVSGTEGQSLRLEGIKVNLASQPYTGSIQYKTHIQNLGWETSWHANGDMSGTQGQSLRLEAIQIELTGEMADHYDVYYRVHAQNFGDLGWAKNGESAGTAGYGYRLEAIQIQLVTKGGAAPGSTDQAFVQR